MVLRHTTRKDKGKQPERPLDQEQARGLPHRPNDVHFASADEEQFSSPAIPHPAFQAEMTMEQRMNLVRRRRMEAHELVALLKAQVAQALTEATLAELALAQEIKDWNALADHIYSIAGEEFYVFLEQALANGEGLDSEEDIVDPGPMIELMRRRKAKGGSRVSRGSEDGGDGDEGDDPKPDDDDDKANSPPQIGRAHV